MVDVLGRAMKCGVWILKVGGEAAVGVVNL
jgi:hypothetical protein